ncbi:hypothetical protein RFI_23238 [Reticulomyxa filosa]|uniref:Uncharacterized protein n=1 Tax=Reticulomyxa filosa TaxID=46433 RepID=X6MKF2_RETFI|nr:hypothetical protein RFI_23238 [Reticulomyxa filosa]|eukprot:ETO14131.1 hypothetical protein RFI_23238 [Reticulomyxa filosa]
MNDKIIQSINIATNNKDDYIETNTSDNTKSDHKSEQSTIVNEEMQILDFKIYWNREWREANVEASNIVEEMLHQNEQGLIIVVHNASKWEHTNNDRSLSPFSFITLVNNGKVLTEQSNSYWLYIIKSELVILNDVKIDGNVYVVDCKLQCKENVDIAIQVFITKKAIIEQQVALKNSLIQWNTKYHHHIALQLQYYECEGNDLLSAGQVFSALAPFKKYYQLCVDTFGVNHPYIFVAYYYLGIVNFEQEKYKEAITMFEKALQIMINILGNNGDFEAKFYHCLGIGFKEDKVVKCYENELAIRLKDSNVDSDHLLLTYSHLAVSYSKVGQYDLAIEYNKKALKIALDTCTTEDIDVAHLYQNLGTAYHDSGMYYKAIECHEKSLNIKRGICQAVSEGTGDSYWFLGNSYEKIGEKEIAYKYFKETWKLSSALLGEWNELTLVVKRKIEEMKN